jgi:TPR repeat protein
VSDLEVENVVRRCRALIESEAYADALKELAPLAQQGQIEACSMIGALLMMGLGCPRDLTSAVKYLEFAANRGNALAAHNLGTLYMTCEPEWPVNRDLSHHWWEIASKLGSPYRL